MILQKLLRLKLILLVRNSFLLLISFFLISCVGPIKEIKYQIEDSMDDSTSFVDEPTALKDIDNRSNIDLILDLRVAGSGLSNFKYPINGEIIYVPSSENKITSYNFISLEEKWIYEHSTKISAGLSLSKKYIFFIDDLGYLCALSINGNLEWKSYVGETYSPPLALDNSVIVKLVNNKFISLSQIDGSEIWFYKIPSGPLSIKSWAEIIESNGFIFAGISGGKVIALDSKNGFLLWETTYSQPKGSSEIDRSNDTTSNPIVDDALLYAISSNGNIAALTKSEGVIVWSRQLSSFYGMTSDQDSLYITHNSGSIYALSKDDNKVLWRNTDFVGRDIKKGYLFNSLLIVSDFEGYLHFLNIKNGNEDSRIKIGDSPIIFMYKLGDNELIALSLTGILYKLKIKSNTNNLLNEDNVSFQNLDDKHPNTNMTDNNESIFDSLIFWD